MPRNEITREEIIEQIKEYFKNNTDEFDCLLEALDDDRDREYLGEDRYYPMDDFIELEADGRDTKELLEMVLNGSGDRGGFSLDEKYYRYNGWGFLESTDCRDYSWWISTATIEDISENYSRYSRYCRTPLELDELFEMLENANANDGVYIPDNEDNEEDEYDKLVDERIIDGLDSADSQLTDTFDDAPEKTDKDEISDAWTTLMSL